MEGVADGERWWVGEGGVEWEFEGDAEESGE